MKAQLNQAFTYISILIIIGVIVFFGARMLGIIWSSNCNQEKAGLMSKINDFVEQYSDRGSENTELLGAACGAREICFVDSALLTQSLASLQSGPDADKVMYESVSAGTANIFIKGEFTETVGPPSPKVAVDPDTSDAVTIEYKCIRASGGKFRIKFVGQGRTTLIEQG